MPTPLELLLHPVSLAIIASYAALIIWEALKPARKLPPIKGWRFRGLASFVVFFFLTSYLPFFVNPLLAPYQLIDLSGANPWMAAGVGILVLELAVYIWHRCIHHFDFLWRLIHQMHHSAERIDTYGAFYLSPVDMIGISVLGSFCFAFLVGLSPQVTTAIVLITNSLSIFQHANIRTPQWLGYIIQRPESHSEHHAAGRHKNNYCDLPIIDLIFGTLCNPKDFAPETGFYQGASARIADMLLAKDVSVPEEKQAA